jgi:hypothetical protein
MSLDVNQKSWIGGRSICPFHNVGFGNLGLEFGHGQFVQLLSLLLRQFRLELLLLIGNLIFVIKIHFWLLYLFRCGIFSWSFVKLGRETLVYLPQRVVWHRKDRDN